MVSIGALRYDIIADTANFQKGIIATRKELSSAKRLFNDTRTPAENLGIEIEGAARLFNKGAIDANTFARSVAAMGDGSESAARQQDDLIASLRREADEIKQLQSETGKLTMEGQRRVTQLRQTADATEREVRLLRDKAEAERRAAQQAQRLEQVMSRGASTTARFENATERADRELRQLREELRAGAISQLTYERAVAQTNREIMQQRLASFNAVPGIGSMTSALGGIHPAAIAAGVGIGAMVVAVRSAIQVGRELARVTREQMDEIDKLAKASRKIGATAEELTGLRLAAAEFSGMASGQVDMALQRMTRRLSEAAHGTGEAQAAIKALGLDAAELNAMGPAEAFRRIADAIRLVDNESDRLALAFKFFDSEGAALVTTMNAGSDAIRSVEAEAKRLGATLSEADAAAVEAANDAFGRMTLAIEGAQNKLAVGLAPAMESFAQTATAAIPAITEEYVRLASAIGEAGVVARQLDLLRMMAPNIDMAVTAYQDLNEQAVIAARLERQRLALLQKMREEQQAEEKEAIAARMDEEKAKAAAQKEEDDWQAEQDKKRAARRKEIEEAEKARKQEFSQALTAARQFYEKERQEALKNFEEKKKAALKMQQDIAAGPGDGSSFGSAESARMFAEQINQSIADRVQLPMPEPPDVLPEDPKDFTLEQAMDFDDRLVTETKKQLLLLASQKEETARQTEKFDRLIAAVESNGFKRIR